MAVIHLINLLANIGSKNLTTTEHISDENHI